MTQAPRAYAPNPMWDGDTRSPREIVRSIPSQMRAAVFNTMLSDLDDAGVFKLLGDIVQPGVDSPIKVSEAFSDALYVIDVAYGAAYEELSAVADPEPECGNYSFGPPLGEAGAVVTPRWAA